MITLHCHCEHCGEDYKVGDVRIVYEHSKECQNANEDEVVKCPKCGTPKEAVAFGEN